MATRLINNLGKGGPSSCVISVGSWVVHTCISVKLFKTNILEACWRKLWDNEYCYFLCGLQLYESTELTSRYFQVIYVANVCAVLVCM